MSRRENILLINEFDEPVKIYENNNFIVKLNSRTNTMIEKHEGMFLSALDQNGDILHRPYKVSPDTKKIIVGGVIGSVQKTRDIHDIISEILDITFRNYTSIPYEIYYDHQIIGVINKFDKFTTTNHGYGFRVGSSLEIRNRKSGKTKYIYLQNKNLTDIDIGAIYGE